MAKQLQVTVNKIGNNPVTATLSFPTSEIMLSESGNGGGLIILTNGQQYSTLSSVSTLVAEAGSEMIQATIYYVNDNAQPLPLQMAFPSSKIHITSDSSKSHTASAISYLGNKYYASETESALIAAANAGGDSTPTVQTVYSLKTVLTDAQIKALPTTPIEIVPAPGVNKALNVFCAVIRCDFTAGAYTNIDADYVDLGLLPANLPLIVKDPSASVNTIPFATADIKNYTLSGQFSISGGYTLALPYSESIFANSAATLWCTNGLGNFTGGNAANTMSVIVLYSIVDL